MIISTIAPNGDQNDFHRYVTPTLHARAMARSRFNRVAATDIAFYKDDMSDRFVILPDFNSVSHFIDCKARASRLNACCRAITRTD
jgi:hypothetical protein